MWYGAPCHVRVAASPTKLTHVLVVQLEGQENPLLFAQAFGLVTDAAGPYVANDIFNLNYA